MGRRLVLGRGVPPRSCAKCGTRFIPFMPKVQIYCSRHCERIANGSRGRG